MVCCSDKCVGSTLLRAKRREDSGRGVRNAFAHIRGCDSAREEKAYRFGIAAIDNQRAGITRIAEVITLDGDLIGVSLG